MPSRKDQEIADLKKRLAEAEDRIAELSDAEKRLKKIEQVVGKWERNEEARRSERNYPGSAYDLTRRPRGGPWGIGGRRGFKYGIPF